MHNGPPFNLDDSTMWSIVGLFLMGVLARTLISNEEFCARKFFGELLLASIGAVVMYSFGMMQNMTAVQIIFFGSLASLGGVRMIEWFIKIIERLKGASIV